MELAVGKPFSSTENDKLVSELWSSISLYEKWINSSGTEEFNFVDGPPFVSSDNLHYGHILISFMKSTVLYYQRMNNKKITNKLGEDVHGLPIEMVVNKLLNVSTRKDILDLGIDHYNAFCKETIMKFSGAWRPVFESIGRMCDWNNKYRTMDTNFMESVWWIFKQLHQKGLVYRGTRVMPFSPACNTPLSNFEASQNYKEIDDQSLYVAFQMKSPIEPIAADYIIAWTTTPWTLPSNLALCVNPNEDYYYVFSAQHGKRFIVSSHYVQRVFPDFPNDSYIVTHIKKGSELNGMEYYPLFNYSETREHTFRILCDDFVEISGGCGTGVVHLAPGFGEDDYRVCQKNGIMLVYTPIDENGVFQLNLTETENSLDLNGKFYRDCNKDVTKNLENRRLVIKKENIKHSYPFCWRTDTPLIYRAMDAWFIQASSLRDDMLKNNEKINWFPSNIGSGRFKNWLENAKDWCVSRNRFFGTPIPIWQNASDPTDYIVIGSIEELSELSGVPKETITDLHMEFTDKMVIKRDGKTYKRIPEVFDCWFESGSVPLAQHHYPFNSETTGMFEEKEALCDWICEGIDQTRGWFYTLHVISTALFNKPAFKNVVCAGLILAKDGKKMSKRLANYTPPMEVIRTFGADTLRMYMLSLGATSADSSCFKDDEIRNETKTLNQWINSVKFLIEHIKMYEGCTGKTFIVNQEMGGNDYDKWIMSRLKTTILRIRELMSIYSFPKITIEIYSFIEDFTNWFLKFNRSRLKGKEDETEWLTSLNTCVSVVNMFNVAIAPFTPFLSETIYKNLRENNISLYCKESVLLEEYPSDSIGRDEIAERRFKLFQTVCDTIRSIRNQVKLASVKVPVKNIKLFATDDQIIDDLECMREYFNSEEINILQLEISKQTEMTLEVSIDPRFGKVYKAGLKAIKDFLSIQTQEQLKEIVESKVFKVGENEVKMEHLVVKYVSSIGLGVNEVESICQVNNKKITVILDKTQDESVLEKHFMRMVTYHTQKIRKNSGVRPWFKILFFFNSSNSQLQSLLDCSKERLSIELGFPVSLEPPTSNFGKWADETFSYSIGEKDFDIHLIIFKME